MRSNDTTISPFDATAPPDNPVRPPEGTSDQRRSLAARTSVTTSSTLSGKTIADGATEKLRVQSRPHDASASASVRTRFGESNSFSASIMFD